MMLGLLQKNTDYIAVTLSEEDLRVAHLKTDPSGFRLVNVAKRDIRGISEEELPKIIRSVLNDFNVKKAEAICVVPSSAVTTKNIEVPSVDQEEIKSIINLQAGRHTPYSREEIIIDHINIGVFQRNYSKVLLVIINRNIIKKQLNTIEQGGLKIYRALFAPEATARFYSKALGLASVDATTGIIDIGSHVTDFTIIFHETVVACRSIPVGMAHLQAEGQAACERLIGELKKSVESYQSEDIEKLPEAYVLTNDSVKIKELQPQLKEALRANIKILPYLDNLKVETVARKSVGDNSDESFLDIVAAAEFVGSAKIDLLPEEIKLQRSIEAQGKEVIKSGAFAVIILVMICAWFFLKIYFKSTFLTNLQANYKKTRQEAEMLSRIAEKTQIVKDQLANRLVSLETIDELYRIIPEEIYLNNIVLNEDGTITMQGTSESMSRVFSLVTALEESKLFKGVKTNSTAAKKERGKDVAAFELTFRLESAKDETAEEKLTASNEKAAAQQEKAAEKNGSGE